MDENETIRYDEELKQSFARFGYITFLSIMFIYINTTTQIDIIKLNLIYIIYTASSIIHFLFIKAFPNSLITIRRYIMLSIDIVGTTFLIHYLNYYGFVFTLLYQWIILGGLIRFGKRYMYLTIIITLISITALYLFNPYWHSHIDMIIYMYLAVTIIPLFVSRLIHRLIKENENLSKLLDLVEKKSKIDSLTMIPNRFSFELEMKRYISRDIPFALLFIDIDGFKGVNDNYGHDIGDEILKEIAQRLKDSIDKDDFVARLGGDEFVVMSKKSREDVLRLAERIKENLSKPYKHGKIDTLSASIGISYYPKDATDEFTLKRYADIAMYTVKREGKNGFIEYNHKWSGRKQFNMHLY